MGVRTPRRRTGRAGRKGRGGTARLTALSTRAPTPRPPAPASARRGTALRQFSEPNKPSGSQASGGTPLPSTWKLRLFSALSFFLKRIFSPSSFFISLFYLSPVPARFPPDTRLREEASGIARHPVLVSAR